MTDHNRYVPKHVREYAVQRRWKPAISAIVMVIACAMVMTVGTTAYADDMFAVTQIEQAVETQQKAEAEQAEQAAEENAEPVPANQTEGTAEAAQPADAGIDMNALADWSRAETANILGKTVSFVDQDGMVTVTSDRAENGTLKDGELTAQNLSDLKADGDNWRWRIAAVNDKDAKDTKATEFTVYVQELTGGTYLAANDNGELSFVDETKDAAKFTLKFTSLEDFEAAVTQDANTKLVPNSFTLALANGRELVLNEQVEGSAVRTYTAKGEENPKNTDPSPMLVYVMKEEEASAENNAADTDAAVDPNDGIDLTASLQANGFTQKSDTVSPKNTLINVFDYWDTNNPTAPAETTERAAGSDNVYTGINNQRALRFLRTSWSGNWGAANAYTNGKQPYQEIVQNTLVDGYPKLSGNQALTGNTNSDQYRNNATLRSQSLNYLFDPSINVTGKASYKNAKGLLSLNNGYYEYDAKSNAARLDTTANPDGSHDFTVYNESVSCIDNGSESQGQFFPFSDPNTVKNVDCGTNFNHFFGMNLVTSFTQQYGGRVSNGGAATTFEFSGDDDVWIFIDDVLVADIGGIHGEASVSIDFSTGKIRINHLFSGTDTPTITSDLRQAFRDAGRQDRVEWSTENNNIFADGTEHTLKFYYLERGHSLSNLWLKYNMINQIQMDITKVDQYDNPVSGATFAVYKGRVEEGSDPEHKGVGTAQYLADNGQYYTLSPQDKPDPGNGYTITTIIGGETRTFSPISGQIYTTNNAGKITFMNNGSYYQPEDMKNDFGNEFIVREVGVPRGYRTVADESVLRFKGNVLVSANIFTTGTVSTPKYKVDATQTLYKAISEGSEDHGKIDYYEVDNDGSPQAQGTLFAVVQHRRGDLPWEDVDSLTSWMAMYGTDKTGYFGANTLVGDSGNTLAGSIAAGKEQNRMENGDYVYESTVFTPSTGLMQLSFEELPGEPDQYYSFIEQNYFDGDSGAIQNLIGSACPPESVGDRFNQTTRFMNCFNNKKNADGVVVSGGYTYTRDQLEALDSLRYMVTYYWTSGTLADANTTNTWRVHSHRGLVEEEGSEPYPGFDIQWGANVRIPNVENRLYFQNFIYLSNPENPDGQDENRVHTGTQFALYRVGAGLKDGEEVLYYRADQDDIRIYLQPDPKRDGKLTDIGYLVDVNGNEIQGTRGVYLVDTTSGQITFTLNTDHDPQYADQYTISVAKNADNEPCWKTAVDADDNDATLNEHGSNYFNKLPIGQYVLRQITAPTGIKVTHDPETGNVKIDDVNGEEATYAINIEEVPVEVTSTEIFANAGGDRNGITVGNGAGFVVSTMNQFASRGRLDESLTWIATVLRVNYAKTFASFEEFLAGTATDESAQSLFGASSWYTTDNEGNLVGSYDENNPPPSKSLAISRARTTNLAQAATTYLEYDPASTSSLFDYKPNTDQKSRGEWSDQALTEPEGNLTTLAPGEGNLRLYTDEGWSSANIWQDYTYGSAHNSNNTDYIDLRNHRISQLYSSSTFVAVYNMPTQLPLIKKVDATSAQWVDVPDDGMVSDCGGINASREENGVVQCLDGYSTPVEGAQFRAYKTENGTKLYRTRDNSWVEDTEENQSKIKIFTSADNGIVRDAVNWAVYETVYGNPDTTEPPKPIVYTLEEVSSPVGYRVVNELIKFTLKNEFKGGDGYDGAVTLIEVEEGTPGVRISKEKDTLYIENEPSVSAVKVRSGTEQYLYVQRPSDIPRPSLEEVQNALNAGTEGYKKLTKKAYDSLKEAPPADTAIEEYLVGYGTTLSNAQFELYYEESTGPDTIKKYYKEAIDSSCTPTAGNSCKTVSWVEGKENATLLESGDLGVILSPEPTVLTPRKVYFLNEIHSPDGYIPASEHPFQFGVAAAPEGETGIRLFVQNGDVEGQEGQGLKVSEDGTILYVENAPIPTIVKVESGTEQYVTVNLDADHQGATCAEILATKEADYFEFGGAVTKNPNASEGSQQTCLVDYETKLQGAEFYLTRQRSDSKEYYSVTADGSEWVSNNTDATVFTSNDKGFVTAIHDDLVPVSAGTLTYTLEEKTAPAGYKLSTASKSITFTVHKGQDADKISSVTLTVADNADGIEVSADGRILYIENDPGVQLPSTGGFGWLWWVSLLAAAGVITGLIIRQRIHSRMNTAGITTGQSK